MENKNNKYDSPTIKSFDKYNYPAKCHKSPVDGWGVIPSWNLQGCRFVPDLSKKVTKRIIMFTPTLAKRIYSVYVCYLIVVINRKI
jgi:hypothetical protein